MDFLNIFIILSLITLGSSSIYAATSYNVLDYSTGAPYVAPVSRRARPLYTAPVLEGAPSLGPNPGDAASFPGGAPYVPPIPEPSYVAPISGDGEFIFDVTKFGAVGDGKTDDSKAFTGAWQAVCGATSKNPILIIPSGKKFLLKPVTFRGPCKSNQIQVQVKGDIVAPSNPSAWSGYDTYRWIVFGGINGLIINGNGQINGQGSQWWTSCPRLNGCMRPSALSFYFCDNLHLSGLKHIDSARNHISISNCRNAYIDSLHISAPEMSPNTDGIDISNSSNIHINNCNIGTGDDCIAINTGTSYINITGVRCGPGHGISVGSLGYHGETAAVEEIYVKSCILTSTKNGVRIKTWEGGSGYARKITFEDITFDKADNPIIIDQSYCPNCHGFIPSVRISDVSYIQVHGTSIRPNAIKLSCSSIGCRNIKLEHINITSAVAGKTVYASCTNAHGKSFDSNPKVDCLLP